MSIEATCSACQKSYRVKDELAGRVAKCRKNELEIIFVAELSAKLHCELIEMDLREFLK